jgi:glycerol-3-phosphate acyltransferase PlsY
MPISKRRWMVAIAAALYLYFLLPATANIFYELYHLTHIGPLYWGYSGFKAAGYYFGVYQYRLPACLLVAAAIIVMPVLFRKLRRA